MLAFNHFPANVTVSLHPACFTSTLKEMCPKYGLIFEDFSAFVQLAIWNTAVPQLILPPWAGCQEKMAAAWTICNYTSGRRAIGRYVCAWGRKSANVTACTQDHLKETLINDLICEMSVLSMYAVVNSHDPTLLQTINHQTTSVRLWDQETKLIIYLCERIRNIISPHSDIISFYRDYNALEKLIPSWIIFTVHHWRQ